MIGPRHALAGWLAALGVATAAVVAAAEPAEVSLRIERHRFEPDTVRVKAGAPFVLVIDNRDPAAEEFESKALRIEKVVPAGKTVRLRLPALKPGRYEFVGEYHAQTARGAIVAE